MKRRIYFCLRFFKVRREKKHAAMVAELNFFKRQIQPHFLFNTLNNLYALTLHQSPQSPTIVLGLSNILRYMFYECHTETVLLKREVEILQSYLSLEKIRYEDRLDLNFSITGNLNSLRIPPLLILPLVENIFKCCISETIHQAWINITLNVKDNRLKFKIASSKPDVGSELSNKQMDNAGLDNVRKRLQLLYPDSSKLQEFDDPEMLLTIMEVELKA